MGARGWSSARLGFLVCGYLAFLCGELVPPAEAGCGQRESPSCCTGRNNDCFEYSRRKTVCYCDTYCQKTRDCCEDYQRVCQISGELFNSLLSSFHLFCELIVTDGNSVHGSELTQEGATVRMSYACAPVRHSQCAANRPHWFLLWLLNSPANFYIWPLTWRLLRGCQMERVQIKNQIKSKISATVSLFSVFSWQSKGWLLANSAGSPASVTSFPHPAACLLLYMDTWGVLTAWEHTAKDGQG